jgi:threonine/homoserine/homoserine lactone efflux protein
MIRYTMLIDLVLFNSLWLLLILAIAVHQQRHVYTPVEMIGWIVALYVSWWMFRERRDAC